MKTKASEGMADQDIKQYDKQWLNGLLERMMLIRRFEERAAQAYGLRKIGGFFHAYIGQEACAVGAMSAVDLNKDYVLTAYRDHGHALAVGMDPKAVMAELFGKEAGCSRGKGGSMHMFDVERNFYGGNGIVGAHLPLATGMALKQRYNDEDGVTLCFFGDGAIHQGSFHESLNMARIWELPVVYICENNRYGMGTDFRRVSSVHDFTVMADSYDITGLAVDGMDVLAMHHAVKEAAARGRQEHRPTLLEARTYRYMGHSISDPAKYRSKEEMDQYKQQDPLLILHEKMKEAGLSDDDAWKQLDEKAKSAVEEAVQFAEQAEQPPIEALWQDVYVDENLSTDHTSTGSLTQE